MSAIAEYSYAEITWYTALHPVTRRRSAVSAEAQTVRAAASAVAESVERSVALFGPKRAAISQILALVSESRENGGDGEEAKPISSRTAKLATDFIRALPGNVPLP